MLVDPSPPQELEEALRRIAQLEAALTSTTDRLSSTSAALATVTAERDKLRRAYEQLKAQLELLRRRIFLAKAERVDTRQLEIEFAETQAKLVKLATEIGETGEPPTDALSRDGSDGRPRTSRAKPKGRRHLGDLDIPEERVEILDPALEGVAERIGFEESYHAGYRRGGPVRIVKARAVYKKAAPTTRLQRSRRRRIPRRSTSAQCSRHRSSRISSRRNFDGVVFAAFRSRFLKRP